MKKYTLLLVAVAAVAATTVGCTSLPPAPVGPNPADPAAVSPPVGYRAVFGGYQSYIDQPVGNWREANDAVGRIGGWREYAREVDATPGAPSPGAPPTSGAPGAAPSKTAPAGHGSHGKH